MTLSLAVILFLSVVALYFMGRTTVFAAFMGMAAGVAIAPTAIGPLLLVIPQAILTAIAAALSAVF